MKKIKFILIALIFIVLISANCIVNVSAEEDFLYIGGIPAGFTIKPQGATIIGLSDVICDDEVYSPSKNADIKVGDIIMSINKKQINGAQSISEALKENKGEPVEVEIERFGEKILKYVTPRKDKNKQYKLGVLVREDLSGIGTITYFKQNGEFASLGHPVLNEIGEPLKISEGEAFLCSIIGVNKGERGKAGDLKGVIMESDKIGQITENRNSGLYGKAGEYFDYKKYEKTVRADAVMGKATILTCIDGVTPREYQISIVKIDKNERENKNLVINIIDKELLSVTNGILQGMSGSPILQGGKIVGAVTHVFINDPTRGFGILIDKMLEN